MITVKLSGGLGNQMFQYAAGRKLSIMKNQSLQLDLSWFANLNPQLTKRKYSLDKFNINVKTVTNFKRNELAEKISNKLATLINPSYHYQYHPHFFNKNKLPFGYFQSFRYFEDIRDIIIDDFVLHDKLSDYSMLILKKIQSTSNSIAIHIRRGDYVNDKNINKHHGVISSAFYSEAIRLCEEKFNHVTLFLFSDDIEWAKNNFSDIPEIIPVSNSHIPDYEEMYLMSCCQNQIIANSSFSWWAAWLNINDNKIVIAPRRWIAKKNINLKDLLPNNWVII